MKHLPKILSFLEKLAVAIFIGAAISWQLNIEGASILIALSLGTLACVYFLRVYIPSDIKIAEGEQLGFQELLVMQILPRVLGISMAVAIIGIQFFLLGLEGYATMIAVGGSTIAVASFIAGVLRISGTRYSETLVPTLFRALIILVVVVVLALQQG